MLVSSPCDAGARNTSGGWSIFLRIGFGHVRFEALLRRSAGASRLVEIDMFAVEAAASGLSAGR